MNSQMTKEGFKLVETKEVSLDHPDTAVTVNGKDYMLSFKNVKIYFYEEEANSEGEGEGE